MPVVGTPGFQDGVQIPAVSLLDSYHKALAFSWVGCKGQEMSADSTVDLCPACNSDSGRGCSGSRDVALFCTQCAVHML